MLVAITTTALLMCCCSLQLAIPFRFSWNVGPSRPIGMCCWHCSRRFAMVNILPWPCYGLPLASLQSLRYFCSIVKHCTALFAVTDVICSLLPFCIHLQNPPFSEGKGCSSDIDGCRTRCRRLRYHEVGVIPRLLTWNQPGA